MACEHEWHYGGWGEALCRLCNERQTKGPEEEDSPDVARPGQWVLSKHTTDPVWCWRVVNRLSGEWHGFGLTVMDAIDLCRRLEGNTV